MRKKVNALLLEMEEILVRVTAINEEFQRVIRENKLEGCK